MIDGAVAAVTLSEAQSAEVERLRCQRDRTPWVRARRAMGKTGGLQDERETNARGSGRTGRTLRRWVRAFLDRGAAGRA